MKKFIKPCNASLNLAAFILCLLLSPISSPATSVRSISLNELADSSEFVFEGRVISVASMMDENSLIRTCVTTADGKIVSEIGAKTRGRRSISTGTASGVRTVERSQLEKAMTVDRFKAGIREIIGGAE